MKSLQNIHLLDMQMNSNLHEMEHGSDHLFITGKAGTGKSTLLRAFKDSTNKRIAVLAPTGIAALQVRGQTIHSFFRFPPKLLDPSEIKKTRNHRFYKKVDIIIIDEISMVRADMMDNIDLFLRRNREVDRPFGGVRMIFFGDLYQLPPIVSTTFEKQYIHKLYGSPYFFASQVVNQIDLQTIQLHKVYRQKDRHFIRLLDNIRSMHFDEDDLMALNERYEPEEGFNDFFITVTPRNATVNKINKANLDALTSQSQNYAAKIAGRFSDRLRPAPEILNLKIGAQVMFLRNDPERKFVNGTLGKITDLGPDVIEVMIEKNNLDHEKVVVEKVDWESIKYKYDEKKEKLESEIVGTFTQYPLRLAWAITIHKSQGQTFDKVQIDMAGGAFEYGQTYVALSRCRSLEGIMLKQPLRPKDIIVDQRIVEYYEMIR